MKIMKYKTLNKRFKDQNPKEVFAHFPYNGLVGETWDIVLPNVRTILAAS